MFKQNIVLTGFMATGKTTVGRILAERTGRQFVDTDELIEERAGRPISEIFALSGEDAFRRMEATAARELAERDGLIVASGGGLMLDPLNALLLRNNSVVICLTARPEDVLSRSAETETRPLLEVSDPSEQIRRLLLERAEGYGRFPQIDTSGKGVEEVASETLELAKKLVASGQWPGDLTSHLTVSHPGGKYEVIVGNDLLPQLSDFVPLAGQKGAAVIAVTDSNVGPLYADRLKTIVGPNVITLPAGEQHKNLNTISLVYDQLVEAGLDRQGTIVALGGGVVGDSAGFAAATYMRGVNFVQCPTSLLAMVDASVGGKTGVDLPQGKNLVGAFKQPEAVIVDLDTLKTLPAVEMSAGMAEIIKHSLISSPPMFKRLEGQGKETVLSGSTVALQALVVEAIQIKRDIVESDPFEQGRRAVLNLGHTFAHALETVSNYHIRHGEAVAIGLGAAVNLSISLGHCSAGLAERIENVLFEFNLPTRIPTGLSTAALLEAMRRDKKKAGERLRFVLLRDVGDAFVSEDVPQQFVEQTIHSRQE